MYLQVSTSPFPSRNCDLLQSYSPELCSERTSSTARSYYIPQGNRNPQPCRRSCELSRELTIYYAGLPSHSQRTSEFLCKATRRPCSLAIQSPSYKYFPIGKGGRSNNLITRRIPQGSNLDFRTQYTHFRCTPTLCVASCGYLPMVAWLFAGLTPAQETFVHKSLDYMCFLTAGRSR